MRTPDGAEAVGVLDGAGRPAGVAAVTAVPTAPFGDYGDGAVR